ncbi:magnesium dechelatase SGRL, chloroplastic-like [Gossypium hirsutum]|uniref:Magnesium dechelatase SGRL, chloroplastic-like n=1 Tax=Gossypium hirsutum TaxID=3635 RepID=A0A1U8KGW4_GOSHI|nr:magnesium dechelatase SGRL, chloroplastic-like [Gossypium hirsutum]
MGIPVIQVCWEEDGNEDIEHALLSCRKVQAVWTTATIPTDGVVRLLGPPTSFQASKLKVVFMGKGLPNYSADFTANLTFTISNVINLHQLKGWYNKDDVAAEWKKVKETTFLNVHCNVGGPNLLLRSLDNHIFSEELPLLSFPPLNQEKNRTKR